MRKGVNIMDKDLLHGVFLTEWQLVNAYKLLREGITLDIYTEEELIDIKYKAVKEVLDE